jgi:hypothetical protein
MLDSGRPGGLAGDMVSLSRKYQRICAFAGLMALAGCSASQEGETLSARDAAAAGQDLTQRAEALRRRAAELRDLPL